MLLGLARDQQNIQIPNNLTELDTKLNQNLLNILMNP